MTKILILLPLTSINKSAVLQSQVFEPAQLLVICTIFACILGWGQVFEVPIALKLVPLSDTRDSISRAIKFASRRAIGTMWNPNIFRSFVNLSIAHVFGRIMVSTRKLTRTRLFNFMVLVFFVLTIFQTASRTSMVGIVVIFIVIFTIVDTQKKLRYSRRIIRPLSLLRAGLIFQI